MTAVNTRAATSTVTAMGWDMLVMMGTSPM